MGRYANSPRVQRHDGRARLFLEAERRVGIPVHVARRGAPRRRRIPESPPPGSGPTLHLRSRRVAQRRLTNGANPTGRGLHDEPRRIDYVGPLHRNSGFLRPLLRPLDSRAGRVLALRRRHRLAAAARARDEGSAAACPCCHAGGDPARRNRARLLDRVGVRNGRTLAHRKRAAAARLVHAMDRLARGARHPGYEPARREFQCKLAHSRGAGDWRKAARAADVRGHRLRVHGSRPARNRHRRKEHRKPPQQGSRADHSASEHANRRQVPKIHARPQRNERVDRLVVWAFALLAGLELATAWGVIAFVLNYIPFIGPLVATVFPTLFALVQFGSWQLAAIVFLGLNVIQFLIGSYLEPRIAGAALSVSPFLVLFAVFFWAFLWGLPGAFIGVPILIAALTLCEQREYTRWIATLLSGRERL